jgi:lysozyme
MSLFKKMQSILEFSTSVAGIDQNVNSSPNAGMTISEQGLNLIEFYEGLRLTAYLDTSGIWTEGYGHTNNVVEGDTITFDEAVAFLAQDLQDATNGVINNVIVVLQQYQLDALISFVYNIGIGNFLNSTAIENINNGNMIPVPYDISLWNRSGGRVSLGLVNRRHSEAILFASGNLSLAPVVVPDDNQE